MPLNSIQNYTVGLLDGLAIPGQTQTLRAYITPPTVTNLNGPIAVVQGGRLRGSRQTAPRGFGFKKLEWVVDVWLAYLTNPNSPTIDQEFAVITDAIMAMTWTTVTPTEITDEVTGVVSQILNMGEEFDLDCAPDRTPASLRMVYQCARLGLSVYEAVQA